MIIDIICDRKQFGYYDGPQSIYDYAEDFGEYPIIRAFDSGKENDIKEALCAYIDYEGYNPELKQYINSVNWLEE